MNLTYHIRKKLKDFGFRSNLHEEIQAMGIQLTLCQFFVVILSLLSMAFLFIPLVKLQNPKFMLILFGLSLLCLCLGIFFWVKRDEICEHPEEVEEQL